MHEEIGFEEGIHPLDLKSLKVDNNFLSLSDKDGTLQVYSFKDGYVDKVNHLDFIDEITDLNIFQDYLFAIGNNETKDGLLQFKGYGNQIYYNSFFQNFPISFSDINDIYIIDDVIYLGLDSGLISAKLNSSSLYLSSEWTIIDDQASVLQITDNFYFTDNSIKKLQDTSIVLNINSKPIDSKYDIQSSTLNWIDEHKFYELDINGQVWEFVNPYDLDGEHISINAFDRLGHDIVIGIENHGLTHISRLNSHIQTYIPNSILSNQISALLVSEDGTLSGVGQKVGFYSEDNSFLHFYSMAYGYDYPNWNEGFPAYKLNYLVGNFFPTSILKSNRDTYLFNNYGIFLNSDISSGGVVEFNSINREVLIFGKDDGVLDGTGGIVSENTGGWYSRIPKLKKHLNGDIWVLNALAEHTNNIVAIQKSNGDWIHITAPDTNSYLPTDFDFGPNGFVWFGFKRFDDPYQYVSSGGLKILNT